MPAAIANRSQIADDNYFISSEGRKDETPISHSYSKDKASDADMEDDFDDFEEGAEYDDFGDFNGEFEKSKPETSTQAIASSNENINFTSPQIQLVS